MTTFTWNVTDDYPIEKLQQTANRCGYVSDIFTAFGHHLYLSLYPNGSRKTNIGDVVISLDTIQSSIKFKCTVTVIQLNEIQIFDDQSTEFEKFSMHKIMTHKQLLRLNTLTIQLKISHVTEIHRKLKHQYKCTISNNNDFLGSYNWNIDNYTFNRLKSDVFKLNDFYFIIHLRPKSDVKTIALSLSVFKPNFQSLKICYLKCTFSLLMETKIKRSFIMKCSSDIFSSPIGFNDFMLMDDITKHSKLNVQCDITIYYAQNKYKKVIRFSNGTNTKNGAITIPKQMYEWKISDDDIKDLLNGYIRNIQLYIPHEIKLLCLNYFGLKMNRIKSIDCVRHIDSKIFKMHGLFWYLSVYPDGFEEKSKGNVSVYLHLAYFPKHELSHFYIYYKLTLSELNIEKSSLHSLFVPSGDGFESFMTRKDLLKLESFHLKIQIAILSKYTYDKITNKLIEISNINDNGISNADTVELKPDLVHTVQISDPQKLNHFKSMKFGYFFKSKPLLLQDDLELILRIYPCGCNIYGNKNYLEMTLFGYSKSGDNEYVIQCKIIMGDLIQEATDIFTMDSRNKVGTFRKFMARDQFELLKMNQFKFRIEITIIKQITYQ